jgi:chromosome segregation ATPase
VAAGLFVWSKTNLGSYGCAAWKKVKVSAVNQVPLEFEIDRLRNEVTRLVPDMRKNLSVIAQEMVAVENLKEDIANTNANLDKQREKIRAMKENLKKGVTPIVYNGRSYRPDRVRDILTTELAACQRAEEAIKHKEQLLEAKEKSLDAAREQLESIKGQKQQLEVELARLEAEVKTLRVAQTRSKIQLDDSRLAQIKGSLAEVRNRLKAELYETDLAGRFNQDGDAVETKAPSNDDVIRNVEAYLGETSKNKVTADRR